MFTRSRTGLFNVLRLSSVLMVLGLFLSLVPQGIRADDENSQFFSETNHTVTGKFLEYWRGNGGLAAYGFPITDAKDEVDPETGKTFLTQWFERNRFELHPENAGTRYEVLLGLLGKDLRREALALDPDFVKANGGVGPGQPQGGQLYFTETGHFLRASFLEYWTKNGGLERFGYPISEEHPEVDPETGKPFLMQWFERARFEYHPENKAPFDILLGLLGNQIKTLKSSLDLMWKIGRGYNDLQAPYAAAVDAQGNVFVTDVKTNTVWKYDNLGRFITKWGSYGSEGVQQFGTIGIAVDQQGVVYILDNYYGQVQKFDNEGRFLGKWGNPGSADGQLGGPSGIAIDNQRNVYIIDASNRVQKFDNDGRFLTKWGSLGFNDGQFSSPYGIAVDRQNNVYVTDNLNGVQKFDSNGRFITRWGSPGKGDVQIGRPLGIAVDQQDNVYVSDTSNYQIQKFDSSGRFLTKWGSPGSGDGQFSEASNLNGTQRSPAGIAIDQQGQVFVIDAGNKRVQKFDSQGHFLGKWGSSRGYDDPNSKPAGIAVDAQGNFYVVGSNNSRVQKYNNQGHLLTEWDSSQGIKDDHRFGIDIPPGIAVDREGNVYITDRGKNIVKKFDSQGRYQLQWGGQSEKPGEILTDGLFNFPTAIAVDQLGNVYVTDSNDRIQKFNGQGHFLTKWGSKGEADGQFYHPTGITVDQQGNVYVVDPGNSRIQKFDSQGRFQGKWGSPGIKDDQFYFIIGIASDLQGNVYITDIFNHRVEKFDGEGHYLTKLGKSLVGNRTMIQPDSVDGYFAFPSGIAVDGQGNVFVADTENNRVQKFRQR